MTKKNILTLVKTVLPLLIGGYIFWWFFSGMTEEHIQSFKTAIREANYFWIILSLGLGFVALCSRATRWKYMLEPMGYSTPFWHRYHAMMIGYLINFTIPRAGEASRSAMLQRSDNVPFSKSFGTIVAERAVDVLLLGIVTLITMAIGYDDLMLIFDQISTLGKEDTGNSWIVYTVLGIIALVGILLFIFSEKFRGKLIEFIKGIINGVFAVFRTKHPGSFVGHSILIWLCYIAMFVLPFYALDATSSFPWSGFLIGFIAGTVGISLTNGGVGVYPFLVGLVVAFYLQKDYPNEAEGIGKALGMLIWTSQTLFMVILGLISLVLLPKNYKKENVENSISRK